MNLLKSFSTYTLVGVLNTGISLIVMPILTYYLSPSDYGTLALFNTYILITIPFLGLTSTSIIGIKYFKLNKIDFRDLMFSIMLIIALFFFLFTGIISYFKSPISVLIEIPEETIYLIPIISMLVIVGETLQNLLIIKKKVKIFSTVVLSKVLIEVTMSIILIVLCGLGWQSRIDAWLIASCSLFLFSIYYFYKQGYFKGKIKLNWIKKSLIFGIPLIPHQIGKLVINQSDRIFLSKMISLEVTGLYTIGYLVGTILLIFSTGAMNVFSPFLLERLTNINAKKKVEIVKISYIILGGMLGIFIFINILSPFIFKYVLDPSYAKSEKYVFWISLSYFFWSIYLVFTGYIFFLKKTIILSILSVISITINLIGNYFFILYFGAIGAAYSTALSFFILTILIIIISQRIYPMPWFKIKKILDI